MLWNSFRTCSILHEGEGFTNSFCWWLKSGVNQLRLVVEIPWFTGFFLTFQVFQPSTHSNPKVIGQLFVNHNFCWEVALRNMSANCVSNFKPLHHKGPKWVRDFIHLPDCFFLLFGGLYNSTYDLWALPSGINNPNISWYVNNQQP